MDIPNTLSKQQLKQELVNLCKWRVVSLMLVTAAVGMGLAPTEHQHTLPVLTGLVGIGLLACTGGVLNQVFEYNIDKKMSRTRNRPLVKAIISSQVAMTIALTFLAAGSTILLIFTNKLTFGLTLFTMFGYSVIYTKLLKPTTSQNIVIGGLFGAMPPLLGWTALTGEVHALPVLLVAIIFTWTPSHFWALSLAKIDDYEKTGLPMLPITHGVRCTQIHILAYTILLILVTQLPYLLTFCSSIYLVIVNIANLLLLRSMYKVFCKHDKALCWMAFKHSNIYLLVVFIALFVDHLT